MNIVDQLVNFINGIIDAIKALVKAIRDFNDGKVTTVPSTDADTDVIA